MNASQRKYLIDEIKKSAESKVKALRDSKPEYPSLSNYLLHAVMSGKFNIKSNIEIMEMIRQKALNAKEGSENWLAQTGHGRYSAFSDSKNNVIFKAKDFFEIPEEYQILADKARNEMGRIDEEIRDILLKEKGLITRITLASDKTLQRMINEVDDMGDLSLVDESLKLSTSGDATKFLEQPK